MSSILFQIASGIFRRGIRKKLQSDSYYLANNQNLLQEACVISSPSAWKQFEGRYPVEPERLILDAPLQVKAVQELETSLRENKVVGIGGGRVIDCAKAVAKHSKKKCILIPTILSTTAWLNAAASLKQGPLVHHAPGRIDQIIIDPELIAASPASLNGGGLADILCAYNALCDWQLAHATRGERMPRDAVSRVMLLCERIKNELPEHLPLDAAAIPFLVECFVDAMATCWGLLSGRPVEGSEHILYYALEEVYDKPMNHGAVIALNTLASLRLRGESPFIAVEDLQSLYERLGVPCTLAGVGIPPRMYEEGLRGMSSFVRQRKLPYSWWNVPDPFQNCNISEVVDWLRR